MRLVERHVGVAPPDPLLGARLAHDELVLRRAAGELAGVDDQRPSLGEPSVTAAEGVGVELRRGRIPEHLAGRARSRAAPAPPRSSSRSSRRKSPRSGAPGRAARPDAGRNVVATRLTWQRSPTRRVHVRAAAGTPLPGQASAGRRSRRRPAPVAARADDRDRAEQVARVADRGPAVGLEAREAEAVAGAPRAAASADRGRSPAGG